MQNVKFKKVRPNATIPTRAHRDDAGLDLYAAERVHMCCGDVATIPTGIALGIHPGFYAQIVSRSGLTLKSHLRVANSPGTIDPGFRGEVMVIMENLGEAYTINAGERIAQLILREVVPIYLEEVDDLGPSDRGENGFGSTGV